MMTDNLHVLLINSLMNNGHVTLTKLCFQ